MRDGRRLAQCHVGVPWRVVACCGLPWCVVACCGVCCGVPRCVVACCGLPWCVVACCGVPRCVVACLANPGNWCVAACLGALRLASVCCGLPRCVVACPCLGALWLALGALWLASVCCCLLWCVVACSGLPWRVVACCCLACSPHEATPRLCHQGYLPVQTSGPTFWMHTCMQATPRLCLCFAFHFLMSRGWRVNRACRYVSPTDKITSWHRNGGALLHLHVHIASDMHPAPFLRRA